MIQWSNAWEEFAYRQDFRSVTCSFGYILLPQIFQLITYLDNCYNILCLFIFFEYILNLDCSCLWKKQNNSHILFCLFHRHEQYGIYLHDSISSQDFLLLVVVQPLVADQIEHSKIDSISPRALVLLIIYIYCNIHIFPNVMIWYQPIPTHRLHYLHKDWLWFSLTWIWFSLMIFNYTYIHSQEWPYFMHACSGMFWRVFPLRNENLRRLCAAYWVHRENVSCKDWSHVVLFLDNWCDNVSSHSLPSS